MGLPEDNGVILNPSLCSERIVSLSGFALLIFIIFISFKCPDLMPKNILMSVGAKLLWPAHTVNRVHVVASLSETSGCPMLGLL